MLCGVGQNTNLADLLISDAVRALKSCSLSTPFYPEQSCCVRSSIFWKSFFRCRQGKQNAKFQSVLQCFGNTVEMAMEGKTLVMPNKARNTSVTNKANCICREEGLCIGERYKAETCKISAGSCFATNFLYDLAVT